MSRASPSVRCSPRKLKRSFKIGALSRYRHCSTASNVRVPDTVDHFLSLSMILDFVFYFHVLSKNGKTFKGPSPSYFALLETAVFFVFCPIQCLLTETL